MRESGRIKNGNKKRVSKILDGLDGMSVREARELLKYCGEALDFLDIQLFHDSEVIEISEREAAEIEAEAAVTDQIIKEAFQSFCPYEGCAAHCSSNGLTELEPGTIVALGNPLRVHIRALKSEGPICEIPHGENIGTEFEAILKTVEEVKKVYPNAEISVVVEV